jgi:RNA polymerase-binding transcription factor DksA
MAKNDQKKTRYTDSELDEFKELINTKLDAAKKEYVYLQEQINRSNDPGTDDTQNKLISLDDSNASMEREHLNLMAQRQQQYIDHLEKALIRIENKIYGVCRETGNLISKERLKAVPHATLSIEAKKNPKK